jgi:hypothetical protein
VKPRETTPIAERFWAKVDKTATCWLWRGSLNVDGYGRLSVGRGDEKRDVLAHRISWEMHVGPIPEGLVLDHVCGTPACVNPAHLEPVAQRENVRRAGSSPSTLNAAKTHCLRGHPFDEENTRLAVGPTGRIQRQCRACHRADARAAYTARPRVVKTHCAQGHLFDEANTRYQRRANGGVWRICRTCWRATVAKRRRAAREAAIDAQVGHLYRDRVES